QQDHGQQKQPNCRLQDESEQKERQEEHTTYQGKGQEQKGKGQRQQPEQQPKDDAERQRQQVQHTCRDESLTSEVSQVEAFRLQTSDFRLQTSDFRLQTSKLVFKCRALQLIDRTAWRRRRQVGHRLMIQRLVEALDHRGVPGGPLRFRE